METKGAPVIVVGVDGTPAGQVALEFALREGAARGGAVDVVSVWTWHGPHEALSGPASPREARDRAQRVQDEAVAEALARVPVAPVVSRQVVEGDAGQVLVRAGRDADYLVVGSAHKGLVKRAFLGSVSEHCVRHATCPVVVVPATQRAHTPAPLAASSN